MTTNRSVMVLAESRTHAVEKALDHDWGGDKPVHAIVEGDRYVIGDVHPDERLYEVRVTFSIRDH